jgi:hypothetical protein
MTHIQDISDEEIERRFAEMMGGLGNPGATDGTTT